MADSSLRYDRTTKLRLYARAGIPEYWIVGVADEWSEIYRVPEGEGYREGQRVGRGESLAPAAFPDIVVSVDDVFA